MWHNYHSVSSLAEALSILDEQREKARIVAGATDLIIEIERKVRRGIESVVDITRIPGLNHISQDSDGVIHLGPLVTHNACVASSLLVEHALPLVQACWEVGAPQIRNRATVAGNLITASPANDTITPLMALNASVTLQSLHATRTVSLRDFYTGVRRTVMQPNEMLVDIAFPALTPQQRGMFIKLALRRAQAISVVDVAVILGFDPTHNGDLASGPVTEARISLGSVAPTIVRAVEAEAYLVGRTIDETTIENASKIAAGAANPIDDVRGPAWYRKDMLVQTASRALNAIRTGQHQGWLPHEPVLLSGRLHGQPAAVLAGPLLHTEDGPESITTTVNGQTYSISGANDKTLLRFLREDVGLIGTKEGCAEGECGACTVFLDGAAVMACMVPAPRAHGSEIVTVEGLAQNGHLHPIQQAFVEEAAVQCGYCTPGLLMAGAKLLEERPQPTRWEAQQAIMGNLCRCTGYYKILAAFDKAAHIRSNPQ